MDKRVGAIFLVFSLILFSVFFVSAEDTSPPKITLIQPSSGEVFFTWVGGVEVIIQTNEPSNCWQSFREDNVKLDNPLYNLFDISTKDTNFYSVTYGGLKDGVNDYYIKCRDASGNVNQESFHGVVTAGDNIEVDYIVDTLIAIPQNSYSIGVVVLNKGNKDAPRKSDAWVTVYGKDSEGKKLFVGQKSFEVPVLKKGESFSYTLGNWMGFESGEYSVEACVDTSKKIWESWANEDNNCAETIFSISGNEEESSVTDYTTACQNTNIQAASVNEVSQGVYEITFKRYSRGGVIGGVKLALFNLTTNTGVLDFGVAPKELELVDRKIETDIVNATKLEYTIYFLDGLGNEWLCPQTKVFNFDERPLDEICTDTDGGKDYTKQGRTTNQTGYGMFDFCPDEAINYGSNSVAEYFCDSSGNVIYESHVCEFGCSGGKCLVAGEVPAPISCDDFDGGVNLYEASGAEDSSGKRLDDACASEGINGMLREAVCKNNVATYQFSGCSGDAPYCSAGKCVSDEHQAEPEDLVSASVISEDISINEKVFDAGSVDSSVDAAIGNAKTVGRKIVVFNKQGDYEIEVGKQARLLAVVPVTEKVKVTVDSQTGNVVGKEGPWWGGLALDIRNKENNGTGGNTIAVTIIDDTISYSVGQEFPLEARAAAKQVNKLSANWSISIGCEIIGSSFGAPSGGGESQFLSLYAKGVCSQSGRKLVGVRVQGDSENQTARDFSTILIKKATDVLI